MREGRQTKLKVVMFVLFVQFEDRWVQYLCKKVAALFTAITLSMLAKLHAPTLSNDCCSLQMKTSVFCHFYRYFLSDYFAHFWWDVFSANPIQSRSQRGISEIGLDLTKVNHYKMRQNKVFPIKSVFHQCFNLSEIYLALVGSRAWAKKFFVLFRVSHRGFPGFIYLIVNASISLLLRFFSTFHFHAPCIHQCTDAVWKLRFHLLAPCSTIPHPMGPTQRPSNPTHPLLGYGIPSSGRW